MPAENQSHDKSDEDVNGKSWVRRDDLVGPTEIAERTGVGSSAVANWAARHEDFPAPVVTLRGGRVYAWSEVEAWIAGRPSFRTIRVKVVGASLPDDALFADLYEFVDGVLRPTTDQEPTP